MEPEHQVSMGPPLNYDIASLLGEENGGYGSIACYPIKDLFVASNAVTLINRGLQLVRGLSVMVKLHDQYVHKLLGFLLKFLKRQEAITVTELLSKTW